MFGLSRKRVRTAPRVKSFLRLEELGVRETPTDLSFLFYTPPPTSPPPPPTEQASTPAAAPKIDAFTAAETSHGYYLISGHVAATNPQGLVVTFDGVPALKGRTATCNADGNFTLVIQVATDGTDTGTITAQTSQNGVLSNVAYSYMNPTP
jgi:hypothetical protein